MARIRISYYLHCWLALVL